LNCKLIIIGNEILSGFTKDTNSFFLINELFKIGIQTSEVVCVKDNIQSIQSQIDFQYNLIILTGGLGPTSDDLTSESLFKYFKKEPNSLIKNSIGTAPGLSYIYNDTHIIALPGVPSELKNMIKEEVLPNLLKNQNRIPVNTFQVNIIGIPESRLIKLLADFETNKDADISMSYLPENVVVKLRFLSKSTEAESQFQSIRLDLRKILGNSIFHFGNKSFELFMSNLFLEKEVNASVAESCTGGYLSHLMTSFSGSSRFFKGGINAYSDVSKINILNLSKDLIKNKTAVCEEVAIDMAKSVRKIFNSDYGIATTGYVGPGAPKGLMGVVWLACISNKKTVTKMLKLKHDRKANIIITSRLALNLIREQII